MRDAEEALLGMGFSQNQRVLISKYITAAIIQSQWAYAKSWQNLPQK
jgi:hypothetical protein